MEEQVNSKGVGPMIGIIIVILVLIVGGFYFYGKRIEKQKQATTTTETTMNTSDEIADLQDDLNSLNADNIGGGVDNL